MFRNMTLDALDKDTGMRERLRLATVGKFEGIDIDIEEASSIAEKESPLFIKGMMNSFNIKPGGWRLPFAIDADEKDFLEGLQNLERYAKVAASIEAFRALAVIQGGDEELNRYAERLSGITDILKVYGCRLGIYSDKSSPGVLAELCGAVKDSGVGIVLDSCSWYFSGGSLDAIKKLTGVAISYVYIGDVANKGLNDRKEVTDIFLPGETGVVDITGFLRTLEDIGYDGPVATCKPSRDISLLPQELAVSLMGGALFSLWKKVFETRTA